MSSSGGGSVQLEVERKLDVAPDLPAAAQLVRPPAGISLGEPVTVRLEAEYFDTDDLRLAQASMTLRRRTGGPDEGWHLKLPGSRPGERHEVRLPLSRGTRTVPARLRRIVALHSGGAALAPVVRLTTDRVVVPLLADDGRVLAELADDRVRAVRLGGAGRAERQQSWREVEVELVEGDRRLLRRVATSLQAAGATPSATTSKLARALDGDLGAPVHAPPSPDLGRRPRSADVALAYVRAQVAELRRLDPLVRAEVPDSVHRMRAGARRLRSALKAWRKAFDRATVDHLRTELRWLGQELGEARDAEVLRRRLLSALDDVREGASTARTRRWVETGTAKTEREAFARLLVALDGPRYQSLMAQLQAFVDEPPRSDRGRRRDPGEPRRLVRAAAARVDRAHAAARGTAPGPERDHGLHDARKATKQARYVAEASLPVLGEPAARAVRRWTRLQSELGEHQDSVVLRERLVRLAAESGDAEVAFTLGHLHGVELARSEAAERAAEVAWRKAVRASRRVAR